MRWYTVIGLCEEQRHCFHVQAESPEAAEKKCVSDHVQTSCTLTVAGVIKGRHQAVEQEPA